MLRRLILILTVSLVTASAVAETPYTVRPYTRTRKTTVVVRDPRGHVTVLYYYNTVVKVPPAPDHWDRMKWNYVERTYGYHPRTAAPQPRTSTNNTLPKSITNPYIRPSIWTPPLRE